MPSLSPHHNPPPPLPSKFSGSSVTSIRQYRFNHIMRLLQKENPAYQFGPTVVPTQWEHKMSTHPHDSISVLSISLPSHSAQDPLAPSGHQTTFKTFITMWILAVTTRLCWGHPQRTVTIGRQDHLHEGRHLGAFNDSKLLEEVEVWRSISRISSTNKPASAVPDAPKTRPDPFFAPLYKFPCLNVTAAYDVYRVSGDRGDLPLPVTGPI